MAENRFTKQAADAAAKTSAQLTGERVADEGERVKVMYLPKEKDGTGSHPATLVVCGIAGTTATRLRKQHKLPCREWVTMRLRLEAE